MNELAAYAREVLSGLGVTYGDARYVETRDERIEVKNGEPRSVSFGASRGVGVRVIADGRWGFCATSTPTRRAVARACREAMKIARAGRRVEQPPVALSTVEPVVAEYVTPFTEDPFAVPLEDKLTILLDADKALSGEAAVKVRQSFYEGWERVTSFASTEGTSIDQRIVQTGGGISATAVAAGDAQTRSYPHSFRGNFQSTGFEYFRSLDLPGHAPARSRGGVGAPFRAGAAGRDANRYPRRRATGAPGP